MEDEFTSPAGQILPGTVAYRVGGEEACGKGSCVRVEMIETPSHDALEQAVEDIMRNELGDKLQGMKLTILDLKGSETVDFKIDPATLLTYGSKSLMTISFNADVSGEITFPVSIQTASEQWHEYGTPAKSGATSPPRPKTVKGHRP